MEGEIKLFLLHIWRTAIDLSAIPLLRYQNSIISKEYLSLKFVTFLAFQLAVSDSLYGNWSDIWVHLSTFH